MQWIGFCRGETGNELMTTLKTKSTIRIGFIYDELVDCDEL